MRFEQNILLSLAPSLAAAWMPPSRNGFEMTYWDAFKGEAGGAPCSAWDVMDAIHTNNEVQVYSTSNSNLQLSGGETLQFVPRKSATGDWTSGRIETKAAFAASPGGKMRLEASIHIANDGATNKQGVWPAFWALGDSLRSQQCGWPQSGEIDIMENLNGESTVYGTVHCGDTTDGGPCHETTGIQSSAAMPMDNEFHVWDLEIDLTNSDWTQQTLTWHLDGTAFKTLYGSDVGDEGAFATLAHAPVYMILNVAIGGDWPGPPNDATEGGYGSMMEVAYVAVYQSK